MNGFDYDAHVENIRKILKKVSGGTQPGGREVIDRLLGGSPTAARPPMHEPENREVIGRLGLKNEQQFRELLQMKEGEGWMQTGMSKTYSEMGRDREGNVIPEEYISHEFMLPSGEKTWLARGLNSGEVLQVILRQQEALAKFIPPGRGYRGKKQGPTIL